MTVNVDLHIEQAIGTIRDAVASGLGLGAEHILNVSNEHVPLEYGDLEGSGVTSSDDTNLEAAVSYNTPYAARQHEEMSWKHDEGRTAKYLENAANSESNTVGQIIADTVRSQVGS